uniref:Integrase catalytic domain-containing protein n=2 Tax=Nicotiana TaxID=4085 RepID=A0A1S4BHN1_TOBAC|nr:PREDICTED: uncharacterized protein LOC104245419 [Nicotiana sylvestris]XP_016488385.1 PREDICTED: uncharacterized protein LOC107808383 [Nicotiana tabacum]
MSHSSQVYEINEGTTLFNNKGTSSGAPVQLNAKGNLGQSHNFLGNEVTGLFSSKGNAGAGYGHSGGGKQPECSGSAMVADMPLCGDITKILAKWIVDSGASSHMVNDSSLLTNAKTVGDKGGKVHLPTGSVAHELYSGQVRGIGREEDGLYVFNSTSKKSVALQAQSPSSVAETLNVPRLIHTVNIIKAHNKVVHVALWHKRFGHAPLDTLKKLNGFHDFQAVECSSKDLYIPTYDGKRYFLALSDDCSRYTWLFILPTKAEVVVVLRYFFAMIKNVHSTSVKFFRSDNGCEFFNSHMSELLQSLGIIHQSSCIYTLQQNGVAERRHRYILEVARALRFQASVPLRFWGECVNTVVYIINRLPSTILHKKSPFEIIFGHSPSLQHMRVFGCLGYVATVRRPDKFAPRAYPTVFLGYSTTQKGYRMFGLHTKDFHISRDVVFKEDVFLFQHISPTSSTLFPVLDLATILSVAPIYSSWSVPAQSIPSFFPVSPASSDSARPSIPFSLANGLTDHVLINDSPIIAPSVES